MTGWPSEQLQGGTADRVRAPACAAVGRQLLTPDEVMALPGDQQLLFVQGLRPVQAGKVSYLNDNMS